MIAAPCDEAAEKRALAGLFALLLGAKLLTLAIGASPTPFTDEWDADGAGFLKPLLEGHADWRIWLLHDNEHLIFFTRPITLAAYEISGYWDVVLPMILNAALHAAILTLLLAALTRPLPTPRRLAALLLGGGFALIPFGNENTLLGFNSHFYLLIGSAGLALGLLASTRAFSPRWFGGVAAALCAFLCMASGALAAFAAAALGFVQILASDRPRSLREAAGLLVLIALGAAMIALTPHIPDNDPFRATDLPAFAAGCLRLLCWPAPAPFGLILILPGLWFSVKIWREKPTLDDPRWLHLGVMIWVLGQIVALSYGRNGALVSRYLDFLTIGVIANVAALFALLPAGRFARPADLRKFAALVAIALTVTLMANHGRVSKANDIFTRRDEGLAQAQHLRAFLASGDPRDLDVAHKYDLPYPDRDRLQRLLSDPTLRDILPPAINPRQSVRAPVEALKAATIASWPLWLAFGLGLWIVALGPTPTRDDARREAFFRRPKFSIARRPQDRTLMTGRS